MTILLSPNVLLLFNMAATGRTGLHHLPVYNSLDFTAFHQTNKNQNPGTGKSATRNAIVLIGSRANMIR